MQNFGWSETFEPFIRGIRVFLDYLSQAGVSHRSNYNLTFFLFLIRPLYIEINCKCRTEANPPDLYKMIRKLIVFCSLFVILYSAFMCCVLSYHESLYLQLYMCPKQFYLCCGLYLSLVEIVFSIVLKLLSCITISKNNGKNNLNHGQIWSAKCMYLLPMTQLW